MTEPVTHDYAGDPKHCHQCALRAFANAELRTRAVELALDAAQAERDANEHAAEEAVAAWHKENDLRQNAEEELKDWREWAQFVYGEGGPVSGDDTHLRDLISATHTRETIAAEAARDAAVAELEQARTMRNAQPSMDYLTTCLAVERDVLKDKLSSAVAEAARLRAALKNLRIDANRLCDRNLGGTYEADCRRTIADADAALHPPAAPAAARGAAMTDEIRALIAKWRKEADSDVALAHTITSGFDGGMVRMRAAAKRKCADELEALIAAPAAEGATEKETNKTSTEKDGTQ